MVNGELRELRLFLTLAEELHFGRTAERLHLTPSRVSQAVNQLEARLGGRLFERSSRRVRLTPLGADLAAALAPVCQALDDVLDHARQAATGVSGTLRVGMYLPTNGGPFMVDIIKEFHRRHPRCTVTFIDTGFDRDQFDWLRGGEVDLIAIRLPWSASDVTIGPVLSREDRVLAVAASDPLAQRDWVVVDDFADRTVSDIAAFSREFRDAFVPPGPGSRKMVRAAAETIMHVAMGVCVHPTVPSFLDYCNVSGVVAIPIRGMPPSETALVRLTAVKSLKTDAFVAVATEVLAERASRPGPAPPFV